MLQRIIRLSVLALTVVLAVSCGSGDSRKGKFAGTFVDEFGNKFELKEDYSATIQFVCDDKVNQTRWRDGANHDSPFATIEFNGDPAYYYLRDGMLYRHKDDMDNGRCAIKLEYE